MVDEGVVPPWNIVPERSDGYPRSSLLPSRQVAHDRVFLCRKVYDSRGRRMLKNPYWGGVWQPLRDLHKNSNCEVIHPKPRMPPVIVSKFLLHYEQLCTLLGSLKVFFWRQQQPHQRFWKTEIDGQQYSERMMAVFFLEEIFCKNYFLRSNWIQLELAKEYIWWHIFIFMQLG